MTIDKIKRKVGGDGSKKAKNRKEWIDKIDG